MEAVFSWKAIHQKVLVTSVLVDHISGNSNDIQAKPKKKNLQKALMPLTAPYQL